MAASAPRTLKTLAGLSVVGPQAQYSPPAAPLDQGLLAQSILQLQNTLNEVIVRHNELCGAASVPQAGMKVTGAGQAASNLFTAE
jgi:hypothetical protein